jgi:pilus assembly protein CpaC
MEATDVPRKSVNTSLKAVLVSAGIALALSVLTVPLCVLDPRPAAARSQIEEVTSFVRHIEVTRGKSRTFELSRPFATALVGSPEIADVLPMSSRVLYVQGKKLGTTNISIFDQDKHLIGIIDVEVIIDAKSIAGRIRSSTGSPGIGVSSSHEQVILGGEARNAVDAEQAVAIAKAMAPDAQLINLIRVAPVQQVLLKVRFIEASRSAERDLGVNWSAANGKGNRGVSTGLGLPVTGTSSGVPIFEGLSTFAGGTGSPFAVGLATLANRGANVDMMISALETKGLARRLAEPDLVALSGDTASFLAGGEVPVPVVQPSSGATPTITVEYKPYGVQLTFSPTVLANGIINLRLTPTVSELDKTNAIENQGFYIPAITKREARTTIELRDGQSFAIAGLLQQEGLRDISQVPWLGSVPVLGTLFRSSSYQQNETDLVVIVTPTLAAPAAPGQKLATPLDSRLPSNDVDFFLMGVEEVPKQFTDFVTSGGTIPGPFGHEIPQAK